ncbi:MAG TPA: energy transducer TonB [Chitinolyticbacter sp.]|nr:energy transducer TonB [Chitinolyticbacter sp.]
MTNEFVHMKLRFTLLLSLLPALLALPIAVAEEISDPEATMPAYTGVPYIEWNKLAPFKKGAPRPRYPAEAQLAKICGNVTIAMRFNSQGKLADTHIINAAPTGYFEQSALAAVKAQQQPRLPVSEAPKEYWTTLTFRYRIEGSIDGCANADMIAKLPKVTGQ